LVIFIFEKISQFSITALLWQGVPA
jgi:hypothetical protein